MSCGRLAACFAATWLLPFVLGCERKSLPDGTAKREAHVSQPTGAPLSRAVKSSAPIQFVDEALERRIDFIHRSGANPQKDYPTLFGSGIAMLDYDGDGRMDLYFASNRELPLSAPDRSKGNRLYRNLGDGEFEDATEFAKVGYRGFGCGLAVGDVDNDGFPDLFLANLGTNVLYMNNGDGTFRDATAPSGLGRERHWSTGAAFCDIDNDGDLDLYVARYTPWKEGADHPECRDSTRGVRTVCSPTFFPPARHALYRNEGNGAFTEITESAGIARDDGRGLGVIACDLNRDGLIDLFVANDLCPNFIFINKGNGTFEDATELCGAARSGEGAEQSGMGIDAEDLDGDGLPELILSHFRGEYATLYKNIDGHFFVDESYKAGVIADSKPYVGWGCSFADFDNDGFLDLMIVNGHVDDNLIELGRGIPQAEPSVIWKGDSRGRFTRVVGAGEFFEGNHVARAASFGDWNDDGKPDAVIGLMDQRPAMLKNVSPGRRDWIRLELMGGKSNRSAIGARIEIRVGKRVWKRQIKGGGSYFGANDLRLLLGLNQASRIDSVLIDWPSGKHSVHQDLETCRTHSLREPK